MARRAPILFEGCALEVLRQLDQDGACTREELGASGDVLRQAILKLKRKGLAREAILITAEGRAALEEIEEQAAVMARARARDRARHAQRKQVKA